MESPYQPEVVIALDLATKTGWQVFFNGRRSEAGVWDLKLKRGQAPGARFRHFRQNLINLLNQYELSDTIIAYEEITFRHKSTGAAAVYHGLVAIMQEFCLDRYHLEPVHAAKVKKAAVGKGSGAGTDKKAIMAAYKRETGEDPIDDNQADAYYVGRVALERYGIFYRHGLPEVV